MWISLFRVREKWYFIFLPQCPALLSLPPGCSLRSLSCKRRPSSPQVMMIWCWFLRLWASPVRRVLTLRGHVMPHPLCVRACVLVCHRTVMKQNCCDHIWILLAAAGPRGDTHESLLAKTVWSPATWLTWKQLEISAADTVQHMVCKFSIYT